MQKLSRSQARRLSLGAQGFADPMPKGPVTKRHLRRAVDRMGVVQLDSVQAVTRSHELPFLARLGPYDRPLLHEFIWGRERARSRPTRGEMVEVWAHEACLVRGDIAPNLRWTNERSMAGEGIWGSLFEFARDDPDYVAAALAAAADGGPLRASELADPRRREGEWWDGRSDGKRALQWLFHSGQVSARRNHRFEQCYDLPERVGPVGLSGQATPSEHDALRYLAEVATCALGVATVGDITDYFRLKKADIAPRLAECVEAGSIDTVEVEGWKEPGYAMPGRKIPRKLGRAALLSPFDPVVWRRHRAERIFDFHYRIEIYVPEPKRIYGYYVLPFLLGDRIVARVDVKADRASGALLAKGVYPEPCASEIEGVPEALAGSLAEMAGFLGLDRVEVGDRGDLAAATGLQVAESQEAATELNSAT